MMYWRVLRSYLLPSGVSGATGVPLAPRENEEKYDENEDEGSLVSVEHLPVPRVTLHKIPHYIQHALKNGALLMHPPFFTYSGLITIELG